MLFICRLGVPDSRIVLMLADCGTCDPRMATPGKMWYRPNAVWHDTDEVEIDYRDLEVTSESVMRVLTGHVGDGSYPTQVLDSGPDSNVLVFLTGHGGDNFLKFHDQSELMASDLGAAIEFMNKAHRFRNLIVMLDTCQASTMYETIEGKGWIGAASSKRDQSSYALNSDGTIGGYLIDQFSHHMMQFLKQVADADPSFDPSFEDMLKFISSKTLSSEVQLDDTNHELDAGNIRIRDFFSSNDSARASIRDLSVHGLGPLGKDKTLVQTASPEQSAALWHIS